VPDLLYPRMPQADLLQRLHEGLAGERAGTAAAGISLGCGVGLGSSTGHAVRVGPAAAPVQRVYASPHCVSWQPPRGQLPARAEAMRSPGYSDPLSAGHRVIAKFGNIWAMIRLVADLPGGEPGHGVRA
jgi:hypothetical protein